MYCCSHGRCVRMYIGTPNVGTLPTYNISYVGKREKKSRFKTPEFLHNIILYRVWILLRVYGK